MALLQVLAEAVNTIADWPNYECMASDNPIDRVIGFTILGFDNERIESWEIPIRDCKRDADAIKDKYDELRIMSQRVKPLPLDAFPADQLAREVHVRLALLLCAAGLSSADSRRHTAWWVTFLGRMRAGWGPFDRTLVEPTSYTDPNSMLDSFGMTVTRKLQLPPPNGAVLAGLAAHIAERVYEQAIPRLRR